MDTIYSNLINPAQTFPAILRLRSEDGLTIYAFANFQSYFDIYTTSPILS